MSASSRFAWAGLSLGIVFAAAGFAGETDASKGPTLQLKFPEVPGWKLGERHNYDDPSDGYSVPYKAPDGTTMTVYVYNRNLKTIPDGIDSDAYKSELAGAKAQLEDARKLGYYTSVEETGDSETLIGTLKARRFSFILGTKERKLASDLWLAIHKNHFIKLRCTRNAATETSDKSIAKLLEALGEFFKGADK